MLTLRAHAKINWFLHVRGKRPDGFHEIASLMQCVSLYDILSFSPADNIELAPVAGIAMQQNLVYKAAELLRRHAGVSAGARITLEKHIPMAAGLGGGSSDAASTLMGLNTMWGLGMQHETLGDLAAELGSDVPFFLSSRPAIVAGRGELITPITKGPEYEIALIKPPVGVSAGSAYSGVRTYTSAQTDPETIISALNSGKEESLRAMMSNDLEAPVFEAHPEISQIKESLARHGALASLMSGSGSTVMGVFHDRESALKAIEKVMAELGGELWSSVARTIS